MKRRHITLTILIIVCSHVVFAQKMTVKDNKGNVLMEVNDEGNVGSITLPSGAEPMVTTNKLYNVGGVLYWNGANIGANHPVHWNDLTNVPAGFADGVDDNSGGDITAVNTAAGSGLTGGVATGDANLAVNFAGTGAAATVSRSDHNHDTAYYTRTLLQNGSAQVHWNGLTNVPAGFADGVDDIGGNTLDGAYDQGGAGAGRTIIADAGAVKISGAGGLEVDGTIKSGTSITVDGTNNKITGSASLDFETGGSRRILRLEDHYASPNVIGGHSNNAVTSGSFGAFIGGGGGITYYNTVTDAYGVVCGGSRNQAGNGNSNYADATQPVETGLS